MNSLLVFTLKFTPVNTLTKMTISLWQKPYCSAIFCPKNEKKIKSHNVLFFERVKSPWTITNKTPFILNMFCTLRFSNHQRNIGNSDFIFAANKRTHFFLAVKKIINVCYLSMLCNNVNRFPKYLSPIRTTLDKKDWSGSEITNSSI